jgi:hypothetical protein
MPQFITQLYARVTTRKRKPLVWRNAFLYADSEIHIIAFMKNILSNEIEVSVWGKSVSSYLEIVYNVFKDVCDNYNKLLNKEEVQVKCGEMQYVTEPQLHELARGGNAAAQINIQNYNVIYGSNNQIIQIEIQYANAAKDLLKQLHILANKLKVSGNMDVYKQVKEVIMILEDNKGCDPKVAEERGVLDTVGEFIEQLGDKDSTLHKRVAGLEKIGEIASKAKPYIPAIITAGKTLLDIAQNNLPQLLDKLPF